MDRQEIVEALTALAAELERRGVSAEMCEVGGAAIALAFDERRATRDIDAVFEPKNVVYEAAGVVAERTYGDRRPFFRRAGIRRRVTVRRRLPS